MPLPNDAVADDKQNGLDTQKSAEQSIPEYLAEQIVRKAQLGLTGAAGGLVGLVGDAEQALRAIARKAHLPVEEETVLPTSERATEAIREKFNIEPPQTAVEEAVDYLSQVAGGILATEATFGAAGVAKAAKAARAAEGGLSIAKVQKAASAAAKRAPAAVKNALKWAGIFTGVEKGGEAVGVPAPVRAAVSIALPFVSHKLRNGLKSGKYKDVKNFAKSQASKYYKQRDKFNKSIKTTARKAFDKEAGTTFSKLNEARKNAKTSAVRALADKMYTQINYIRRGNRGKNFTPKELLETSNNMSSYIKGTKQALQEVAPAEAAFAAAEIKQMEELKRGFDQTIATTLKKAGAEEALIAHSKANEAFAFSQDLENIEKNLEGVSGQVRVPEFMRSVIGENSAKAIEAVGGAVQKAAGGKGGTIGAAVGGKVAGLPGAVAGRFAGQAVEKGIKKVGKYKKLAKNVKALKSFENIMQNESLQRAATNLVEQLSQPNITNEAVVAAIESFNQKENNFRPSTAKSLTNSQASVLNRIIQERVAVAREKIKAQREREKERDKR